MKTLACCLLLTGLNIALLPALSAQNTPPPETTRLAPAKSMPQPADGMIHLDVVVSPKKGAPVAELQQGNFTLLDDKKTVPIHSFRALGPDAPAEVIILIDALNTTFQTVAYEQQELSRFFKSNEGHLAVPTAIAVLSDSGVRVQNHFTTDGNALNTALNGSEIGLRTLTRSTGFWGAAERMGISLNGLRSLIATEGPRPGRKIIVFISPGWAFFSSPAIDITAQQQRSVFADVVNISDQMRLGRITLDSIDPHGASLSERNFYYQEFVKGVSKPSQAQFANLSLQVLAAQSGGLILFSSNDLVSEFRDCYEDTTAYYQIAFEPSPSESPDDFHQVEVKVDRPGLTARTRNGYYLTPTDPNPK